MLGLSEADWKRLRDLQYQLNVKRLKILEKLEKEKIKRIDGIDEKTKSTD